MYKIIPLILSGIILTGCSTNTNNIEKVSNTQNESLVGALVQSSSIKDVSADKEENIKDNQFKIEKSGEPVQDKDLAKFEFLRTLLCNKEPSDELIKRLQMTEDEISEFKSDLEKMDKSYLDIDEVFGDTALNITCNYQHFTLEDSKGNKTEVTAGFDPSHPLYIGSYDDESGNTDFVRFIQDGEKIIKENGPTVVRTDIFAGGLGFGSCTWTIIGIDQNETYTITPEYYEEVKHENFQLDGDSNTDSFKNIDKIEDKQVSKYSTFIYNNFMSFDVDTTYAEDGNNSNRRAKITFKPADGGIHIEKLEDNPISAEIGTCRYDGSDSYNRLTFEIPSLESLDIFTAPDIYRIFSENKVNAKLYRIGLYDQYSDILDSDILNIELNKNGTEIQAVRSKELNNILLNYKVIDDSNKELGNLYNKVYVMAYTGTAFNPESKAVKIGEIPQKPEIPQEAIDYMKSQGMKFTGKWFIRLEDKLDAEGKMVWEEYKFDTPLTSDIIISAESVPIE